MSKYSTEFKLAVVNYCIEEHYGYRQAAKHFNIPSRVAVQQWVRKYKEHGVYGIYIIFNICIGIFVALLTIIYII